MDFFAKPEQYQEVFADGAWIEVKRGQFPAYGHMIVTHNNVTLLLTNWHNRGWVLHRRSVNGEPQFIQPGCVQREDGPEISRLANEGHWLDDEPSS